MPGGWRSRGGGSERGVSVSAARLRAFLPCLRDRGLRAGGAAAAGPGRGRRPGISRRDGARCSPGVLVVVEQN